MPGVIGEESYHNKFAHHAAELYFSSTMPQGYQHHSLDLGLEFPLDDNFCAGINRQEASMDLPPGPFTDNAIADPGQASSPFSLGQCRIDSYGSPLNSDEALLSPEAAEMHVDSYLESSALLLPDPSRSVLAACEMPPY